MPHVDLRINNLDNWDPWHVALANQAVRLMDIVVNDDSDNNFLAQVLSGSYTYSGYRDDNDILSEVGNSVFVDNIKGGKETYKPVDDVINLEVALERYDPDTKMGYVIPPKPLITTNTNWIDKHVGGLGRRKMDPLSVASHWMHEWLHVAGFRHRSTTKVDINDAVYKIGYLFEEIGKELASRSIEKFVVPYSSTWGDAYLEAVKAGAASNEHACGFSD